MKREGRIETDFSAMADASQRSFTHKQLTHPNPEEDHRKRLFPETCSPSCQHVQCPYRRDENAGKPCEMQWGKSRTDPKPKPLTHSEFKKQLELEIEQALQPIYDMFDRRLQALEGEAEIVTLLDVQNTLLNHTQRIDRNMN